MSNFLSDIAQTDETRADLEGKRQAAAFGSQAVFVVLNVIVQILVFPGDVVTNGMFAVFLAGLWLLGFMLWALKYVRDR